MDALDDLENTDASPQATEESIRAMLERSRSDIKNGDIVPLEQMLSRARAKAEGIRRSRQGG